MPNLAKKEKTMSSSAAARVLVSRKVQTSRESTYVGDECNPYFFYCNDTTPCGYTNGVQDLEVGKSPCRWSCPDQNVCLKPDRFECAIGLDSKNNDPLTLITWDQRAPNLKCMYDLNKIDKIDQLRAYSSKFKDDSINTVMGAFCGKRVSTDCAAGLGGECSRFLAVNDGGRVCREWMASLPRDSQDAVMRDYCLANDTEDCKCINRTTDPDYQRLKSLGNYFSDRCWYRPCANSESIYLVPNRVGSAECAANVCQQIIEAHAEGKIDISGNVNQINCAFPEAIPPGKKDPTPPPGKTEPASEKMEEKAEELATRVDWRPPVLAASIALAIATLLLMG